MMDRSICPTCKTKKSVSGKHGLVVRAICPDCGRPRKLDKIDWEYWEKKNEN